MENSGEIYVCILVCDCYWPLGTGRAFLFVSVIIRSSVDKSSCLDMEASFDPPYTMFKEIQEAEGLRVSTKIKAFPSGTVS